MRLKLLCIVLGCLFAVGLSGQEPIQSAPTKLSHDAAHRVDQTLKHLTKRYRLTAAQQDQVHSILVDEARNKQAIHDEMSLSGRERREKSQLSDRMYTEQFEGVLSPEQRRKFQRDEAECLAWMESRNANSGPPINAQGP